MRLTKHRTEILTTLEKHGALSAGEIKSLLPHINLVTIYRSLESFVESELVRKLSLGGSEARYEIQHEPHFHAVCTDCDKIIHFSLDQEKLIALFKIPDFKIEDIEVTLHGSCHKNHHRPISLKQN
mgnify:CR=1 FL=1